MSRDDRGLGRGSRRQEKRTTLSGKKTRSSIHMTTMADQKKIVCCTRACRVSGSFMTAAKRRRLEALRLRYCDAVNFFIRKIWSLDVPAVSGAYHQVISYHDYTRLLDWHDAKHHDVLPEGHKLNAYRRAIDTAVSTKRAVRETGIRASMPVYHGGVDLHDTCRIEMVNHDRLFDLVLHVSGLKKGSPVRVPTKRTAVLNKWLKMKGAELITNNALLLPDGDLVLYVRFPEPKLRKKGKVIGLDIGKVNLIATSDGKRYGQDFPEVIQKIRRRKPKSKGRQAAYRQRKNMMGREVNRLPWKRLRVVGVEKLRNLKRGKGKRGKAFRKGIASWTYPDVLAAVKSKAQADGVQLVEVAAAYTSRTCPVCGRCDDENRKGERFWCRACGYKAHADVVGAQNVLARTLATLREHVSPEPEKKGSKTAQHVRTNVVESAGN